MCTSCQDPSYAHYVTARAGIIVQDYLNVCHDIRLTIPVNAHTTPALLALANLLSQDPSNSKLLQPTRWSDLAASVQALVKLVALDVDLPETNRTCVRAHHRLLYQYRTPHLVHCSRDYGVLANHTLLETRPPEAHQGTKRKARTIGCTATHNESLAANAWRTSMRM